MMAVEKLIPSQRLSELLQGISSVSAADDVEVTGVSSDSRLITQGDLFIAYQNGAELKYIAAAIEAGASAVLVDAEKLPDIPVYQVPVIPLPALTSQAGLIAARFLNHPSHDMKIVGVTGTNGKTTVSYLIAQIFSEFSKDNSQYHSGLIGTLGYGAFGEITKGPNTTPEAVALQNCFASMLQEKIDVIAMEVSSHGLDQYRVTGVEFDIAVFTNLSRDHLDYHETMENYAATKRRLFSDYLVDKAVINFDDEFGRELISEFHNKIEIIAYTLISGEESESSAELGNIVRGRIVSESSEQLTVEINSPWGKGVLESSLIGKFNASNLLATLSVACLSGISFEDALQYLSRCKSVPGRMESFKESCKPLVVVDYAHSPDALEQALSALKLIASGKLICVFGCGGDRDKGKRSEMGKIAEAYADHIYLTDDNPRSEDPKNITTDILEGISNQSLVTVENDRREAIKLAIQNSAQQDVILIAGKGHEDYQEIKGVKHPLSDREITQALISESNHEMKR